MRRWLSILGLMLGLVSGLLGAGSVAAMPLANSGNLAGPYDPGVVTGSVSSGFFHTCALKTDGTLACWGSNAEGQLDNIPIGSFTQVSASYDHTCAIKTDANLACWGYNGFGQASPPSGSFTQVSAGYNHTCGIKTDGTLACWGDNTDGQATPPGGTYTQVSAGAAHTCGIKTDGALACWGDNGFGQATPPSGTFTQVSAGEYHTCGIKTGGTLACWGDNTYGQLNNVPSGTFTQISAGGIHPCAVTTSGLWACWGDNTYGQSTPAGAATITTQPSDLTVVVGQPATFTVVASGTGTLTYQWYYSSDGATFTPVAGATGSSYTINATALTDAGYYKVAVDSTSAEIQSRAAKLDVLKGTITITASSPTIKYGEAIPAITPSYSGLIPPDTIDTALSTKPTCSTTATSSSLPGSYTTSCSGAVSSTYAIKYVDGSLTITTGTVTITSDPANSEPKQVGSTGGTADFTLKATVKDGTGDISTALPVTYTLTPIGPGNTYTCTDSTGNGVAAGVLASSCAFTGVAPNLYTLTISVATTTFTGSTTDTVTVVDEGLAFATGGGTVSHDGTSGKFLLTAEYKQGTLSGTFKYNQGSIQLTSSSLTALAVVLHGPNGPIAYVSGTATDQNGTSYSFRVTAIDGGLASSQNQLGMNVIDGTGQPVPALSFDPVHLSCGDIVIGSPTSLAARILGYTTGLLGWTECR